MFGFGNFKTLAAAAVLAMAAGVAGAATVLTVDDTYPGAGALAGTATCSQTCAGLVAIGTPVWAKDGAKLFTVKPNDENQLKFVNLVTGLNFVSGTKTNGSGGNMSFATNALYILMKIGGGKENQTFLIHNTWGQGLNIAWLAVSKGGNGLSHYTEFGTAPPLVPVPVPAAGLLLLGALGGLAVLRRRRRAA